MIGLEQILPSEPSKETTCWHLDFRPPASRIETINFCCRSQQFVVLRFGRPNKLRQPRQHIKKQRHYFVNKVLSSQSYGFSSSHVWMWELDYKESCEPKNWCFWTVVLEKTLESPLDCKEIQLVHPKADQSCKDWCWSWNSNTLATSCEELSRWKRPWCGEKLRAGGEGDDGGWDGWMASPTRWTRVWVNSGRLWWTGKPGMLWFRGSQRVGHDWATELNW